MYTTMSCIWLKRGVVQILIFMLTVVNIRITQHVKLYFLHYVSMTHAKHFKYRLEGQQTNISGDFNTRTTLTYTTLANHFQNKLNDSLTIAGLFKYTLQTYVTATSKYRCN